MGEEAAHGVGASLPQGRVALRELGKESVAVFSDVDRRALHVLLADMALPIGPAPASQSYLVIDKILQAAGFDVHLREGEEVTRNGLIRAAQDIWRD